MEDEREKERGRRRKGDGMTREALNRAQAGQKGPKMGLKKSMCLKKSS
jgi:hypothetical protein